MAFTDSADIGGGGAPPEPSPPQQGGGAAPPGGGGAILQALQRQRPQTSAPGMGNQADGMNQLKIAAQAIQQALPNIAMGTPLHTAAINALRQLTRHIQQSGPMGTQQTALQDALRANMRNQMLQQIMQRVGGGGGGSPAGGGGQPGQPPMPSTPLPGA